MPQVILFDAVGTLLRPHPPVAEVYARLGREFGSHLNAAEIQRRFQQAWQHASAPESPADSLARPPTDEAREWNRWRAIVAEVFCELPTARDGLFFALWEYFSRSENWALYDDVAAAIPRIASGGRQVGIASNFDRRLPPICRAFRPLRPLQPVFTSAAVGFSKPCPRFFRAIETALQVAGESILLIGDDFENDFQGARAAGWQALLVDREDRRPELVERVTSLDEVLRWID